MRDASMWTKISSASLFFKFTLFSNTIKYLTNNHLGYINLLAFDTTLWFGAIKKKQLLSHLEY